MISLQPSQLPSKHRCGNQSWSISAAVGILAGIGLLSSSPAALAKDRHLSKKTEPGTAVTIFGHARANKTSCEGTDPPTLQLDKAPDHGSVCSRKGPVKLRESFTGSSKCLDKEIAGVKLIYTPRGGYTGIDHLQYTAVSPGGRFSFDVDITVADKPGSAGGAPADKTTPPKEAPQTAGPVPACPAT